MCWNKTIHITERSKVAASMLMLFFPTRSQIQGDYFLTSLKGPFHTTTWREVSKGVCSMGPAEEQCKPLAWPRHSIPQVQKARMHAPARITWDRLWCKLTQTEQAYKLPELFTFGKCRGRGVPETHRAPEYQVSTTSRGREPAGRDSQVHRILKQWKLPKIETFTVTEMC